MGEAGQLRADEWQAPRLFRTLLRTPLSPGARGTVHPCGVPRCCCPFLGARVWWWQLLKRPTPGAPVGGGVAGGAQRVVAGLAQLRRVEPEPSGARLTPLGPSVGAEAAVGRAPAQRHTGRVCFVTQPSGVQRQAT